MISSDIFRYYFFTILSLTGVKDPKTQQAINLGKEGWSLINAFTIASFITRFKRRHMYLLCTSCMLLIYIGWTVSMATYMQSEAKHKIDPSFPLNKAAGGLVLFFIFAYSPAYNIGFNSLTYSKPLPFFNMIQLTIISLPCGTFPIRRTNSWSGFLPILRSWRSFLRNVCQSHRFGGYHLEIPHCLLLLGGIWDRRDLLLLPRDLQPYSRGTFLL